jgi:transcriptional regulator with XRE-family HTH domain
MSNMLVIDLSKLLSMALLSFSDRLLAAMEAEGLNQAELGRKVGLTRSAINQLVSGSSKGMKPENLVAVARALRVRIEWLATGEEPMRERFTKEDLDDLEILRLIPKDRREAVRSILRGAMQIAQ